MTDNLTGLLWLEDANCAAFFAPLDFEDSLTVANGLRQGFCGLTDGSSTGDWRLPNIKELLSLVDYSESGPTLPSGHPFINVQFSSNALSYYWSSTSTTSINSAWSLSMINGFAGPDPKTDTKFVWTVRGGR